jgi:hypothetical protein
VITTDEYVLWTDRIFLPALHATYPASTLSHLPSSAAHIALNGTASRVEGQAIADVHVPRAQDFHYTLSPSGLPRLWNEVLERMEQEGLQQFQHCQLILTAKNLKLATQRRTWQEARDAFFSRWNRAIDVIYLQQDFYDLAKEMVSSRSATWQAPSPEAALVMTWRRCCLEGMAQQFTSLNARLANNTSSPSPTPSSRSTHRHRWSPVTSTEDPISDPSTSDEDSDSHDDSTIVDHEDGSDWSGSGDDSDDGDGDEDGQRDQGSDDEPPQPPSRRSTVLIRQEFYPQSGLRDQGALTLEPSPKSALWQYGLRYCQHYNTSKEIFAAGKQYPFQNAQVDTLTVDPGMVRTWQHVGGAVSHSPLAVLQAYLHTKRRCHVGLEGCRHRSYGTREEYRVTGSLLVAIDELFHQRELATIPLPSPPDHRPFFTHPTSLILDWFRWNINKLCLGFEMTYSLHPRTVVHWEHTRVMMMFLQCLRLSYGGQGHHLRHSNGLWLDRRARPPVEGSDTERIQEGMGIEARLQATGYMWYADKIDWSSMTFRLPHRAHMAFNTPTLQSTYHERYWRVVETKSDFLLFHDIFARLRQLDRDFRRTAILLQLLVDLCLQLFRKDVFSILSQSKLRQPLRDRPSNDACAGKVPLTQNGLRRVFCDGIFHDDIHFASGQQMAVTHIDVLFARLWGWDGDGQQGDWPRRHWEYKPFRVLYRQCFGTIAQIHGMQQARHWRTRLRHTWIRTHWILPYPDSTTFWPRRADKRLQTWVSVHPPLQAYYQQQGLSVVSPADVEFLPVTGWQRGSEPSALGVDLPPIPSDLDAWLATINDRVSVASLDIPLPACGIRDGPIRRFLQEQAPSQRVLRSAMQEQSLSENKLHRNDNWLTQHLQDHLRAVVRNWQSEVTQHQPPTMTRQWQQRSRPQLTHSLAQLQVTMAQVEDEDSDPDGFPTVQKERQDKLQRMRRRLRLVNAEVQRLTAFNDRVAETEWLAQLKRRPMSDEAWREELKVFRDIRDRRRLSKERLARLSRQALRVDVDPGIL